jgi:RNA polymerase sigma-70 factor (ECF subfamily)
MTPPPSARVAAHTEAFRHLVDAYQAACADPDPQRRGCGRGDAGRLRRRVPAPGTFDPARPFYPWFFVLLRNRCLKQRSRRGTRWEIADVEAAPRVDPGMSEQHLDLWRAIDRLASDEAELVVLKHIEGWTYDELSASLGVPRGTVMSRLYAARQRLLARLSGEPS